MSDPKAIWQINKKGSPIMSLEEVQQRAKRRQQLARREIVSDVVLIVVTMVISGILLLKAQGNPARFISSIVIALLLGGAYRLLNSVYKTHGRFLPESLPVDSGSAPSTGSYRRELERQRNDVLWPAFAVLPAGTSKIWLPVFVLMGLVPTLLMAVSNPELLARIWPATIMIAILFGLVFYARQRQARQIQRELDDLDAFERNPPDLEV